MKRIPNVLKFFIVLILSTPIYSIDNPKIDIISAITHLMILETANYQTLDPLSVSEAFEGCIFKPYEYLPCSNPFCETFRVKDDIYNQPFHHKTKCNLIYKNNYLVEKI
jgi:hypothetical protein